MTGTTPLSSFRINSPFKYEELQAMENEGLLQHIVADVYVPSNLRGSSALRASSIGLLLSPSIQQIVTVCGETAAWIHLGGQPPVRLALSASRFLRTHLDSPLPWQVHQVHTESDDVEYFSDLGVSTELRCAVELFTGIGTIGTRSSLDVLWEQGTEFRKSMTYWPTKAAAVEPGPESMMVLPSDVESWTRRTALLASMIRRLQAKGTSRETVARAITQLRAQTYHRSEDNKETENRVLQTLDYCASRRLPTVL